MPRPDALHRSSVLGHQRNHRWTSSRHSTDQLLAPVLDKASRSPHESILFYNLIGAWVLPQTPRSKAGKIDDPAQIAPPSSSRALVQIWWASSSLETMTFRRLSLRFACLRTASA